MVKLLWKFKPFRLCQVNKLASQPVSFHKTGLSQKPNYVERAWDHSTKTVTTKTRHGSLKTSSWPPQKDEENALWNANPHYYSIYVLLRLLHPHLGACSQWNSNTMEIDSLGSKIYCLCWGNNDIKSHQFTVWSSHKKMLFKRFPTTFCHHCGNTACSSHPKAKALQQFKKSYSIKVHHSHFTLNVWSTQAALYSQSFHKVLCLHRITGTMSEK